MSTTIRTKKDVLMTLSRNRDRLEDLGVHRIGLFGSFARGEQGAGSDIDLLVEFQPDEKTFDRFMALSFYLEEVLRRPVELVTLESLSPYVGPHILDEVEYAALGV